MRGTTKKECQSTKLKWMMIFQRSHMKSLEDEECEKGMPTREVLHHSGEGHVPTST